MELEKIPGRIRKTIWTINEKDFEGLLAEGFNFSLIYFIFLLAIASVLTFISVLVESGGDVIATVLVTIFDTGVYAVGIGLLLPLVSHALISLFGGKRPVTDTFQMYFYTATPSLLLGWIPCAGVLAPLVGFGNVFRGLKEINGLSFWQALVAVLLPSIAYWIVWVVFFVAIGMV